MTDLTGVWRKRVKRGLAGGVRAVPSADRFNTEITEDTRRFTEKEH
jgi:hypothetical protein